MIENIGNNHNRIQYYYYYYDHDVISIYYICVISFHYMQIDRDMNNSGKINEKDIT